MNYSGGTEEGQPSALRDAAAAAAAGAARGRDGGHRRAAARRGAGTPATAPEPADTVVKSENEKLGRNDPCWCGSGKKFKNCHGG